MSPHRAEISLPSDIFHHSIDTSDHLTSLFKIHETLYGGVGDSTTSTFSPSPAEVVDVVNELYELESGMLSLPFDSPIDLVGPLILC